jgi:hypothetical protein
MVETPTTDCTIHKCQIYQSWERRLVSKVSLTSEFSVIDNICESSFVWPSVQALCVPVIFRPLCARTHAGVPTIIRMWVTWGTKNWESVVIFYAHFSFLNSKNWAQQNSDVLKACCLAHEGKRFYARWHSVFILALISCSAKVKERVELYVYSSSRSPWPVLGWTLPLLSHRFLCAVLHSANGTNWALYIWLSCVRSSVRHSKQ